MMQNVIYQKMLVPARRSPDGDTSTVFWLTKEVNGYACFVTSYDGVEFLAWYPFYKGQTHAIDDALKLLSEYKPKTGISAT